MILALLSPIMVFLTLFIVCALILIESIKQRELITALFGGFGALFFGILSVVFIY